MGFHQYYEEQSTSELHSGLNTPGDYCKDTLTHLVPLIGPANHERYATG
jgi:hypothetical protein